MIMDGDRKVNLCEGVPLNTAGAANIYLNTGRNKHNAPDGTVIHLKTEKPADVGVHINTTFAIASSKKIKLLFVLNFLLSVICMVASCSIAFYYWNEMISMKRQLDTIKDQFLIQNSRDKIESSPLVVDRRDHLSGFDLRQPRMEAGANINISPNAKRYYVEDLGEDMVLVDSSKKNPSTDLPLLPATLSILQKEPIVAHFNGGLRETNLGTQSIIGPWVRDKEISSKDSESKVVLDTNFVTIKESGLYLVYAQIVYLTHAPNCFFVWARQPGQEPRLLSTCATGADASTRPLDKSQISCSVQTVARLQLGDTVNIAQREPNRTLWLRKGYSYFGFVKLSS